MKTTLVRLLGLFALAASAACGPGEGEGCDPNIANHCGFGAECINRTCRRSCVVDDDCTSSQVCSDTSGARVCLPGDRACPAGTLGCECSANFTCSWGAMCDGSRCQSALGKEGQPCQAGACESGLACTSFGAIQMCAAPGAGELGSACGPKSPGLASYDRCPVDGSFCERERCVGALGTLCASNSECRAGLDCVEEVCTSPVQIECQLTADCAGGQFCCGDPETAFAERISCGAGIELYQCIDAPASLFERACTSDEACNPLPAGIETYKGVSICQTGTSSTARHCSVPCNPESGRRECPSDFSCQDAFKTCFADADCGGELTCVHKDDDVALPGHCSCRSTEGTVSCDTGMPLMENAECVADPFIGDGEMSCRVAFQCRPH